MKQLRLKLGTGYRDRDGRNLPRCCQSFIGSSALESRVGLVLHNDEMLPILFCSDTLDVPLCGWIQVRLAAIEVAGAPSSDTCCLELR